MTETTNKLKTTANWSITLYCDCPKCGCFFDILSDNPDFWESGVECAEHDTKKSKDVEVYCPDCDCEFLVDLEF